MLQVLDNTSSPFWKIPGVSVDGAKQSFSMVVVYTTAGARGKHSTEGPFCDKSYADRMDSMNETKLSAVVSVAKGSSRLPL